MTERKKNNLKYKTFAMKAYTKTDLHTLLSIYLYNYRITVLDHLKNNTCSIRFTLPFVSSSTALSTGFRLGFKCALYHRPK